MKALSGNPNAKWKPGYLVILWLVVVLAFLAIFTLDLWISYQLIASSCEGVDCHYQALGAAEAYALAEQGFPVSAYALYMLGISVVTVIIYASLALIMLVRLYPHRLGYLFSAILVIIPTTTIASFDVVAANYPAWRVAIQLLFSFGYAAILTFVLTFPNGRLWPRWTMVLPIVGTIPLLTDKFVNDLFKSSQFIIFFFSVILLIFGAVIYRYRRMFNASERQQAKWAVFGILIWLTGFPIWGYTFEFSNPAPGLARLLTILIGWTLCMLVMTALPVSIFFAILRYRLWDVDVLLRRTLQYSLITGTLALVYFGSVTVIQTLLTGLTGQQSGLAVALSTLAIAALFTPIRTRVQHFIDQRFYRQKYNAEQALAEFAAAVRNETDLGQLTSQMIGAVQGTLQPEKMSLWLKPAATAWTPPVNREGNPS